MNIAPEKLFIGTVSTFLGDIRVTVLSENAEDALKDMRTAIASELSCHLSMVSIKRTVVEPVSFVADSMISCKHTVTSFGTDTPHQWAWFRRA